MRHEKDPKKCMHTKSQCIEMKLLMLDGSQPPRAPALGHPIPPASTDMQILTQAHMHKIKNNKNKS